MDILTYYYLPASDVTPIVTGESLLKNFQLLLKLDQGQLNKIKGLQLFTFLLTVALLSMMGTAQARVLQQGDQGADVMALQKALKMQGFFPETEQVSDYYGEVTTEAVKKFQQKNGLTPDGIARDVTQLNLWEKFSEDQAEALLNQTPSPMVSQSPSSAPNQIFEEQRESVDNQVIPQAQETTAQNFATLSKGDQGVEVMQLQTALKQKGYFPPTQAITEYYGEITESSVKKFQQSQNLALTGVADQATQKQLWLSEESTATPQTNIPQSNIPPTSTTNFNLTMPSGVLKLGQKGEAVQKLQMALKAQGYFPENTAVTNYYGNITESSVKKFQQAHGLKVDGIVGKNTWEKIFLNVNSPSTPQAIAPPTATITPKVDQTNQSNNNIDLSLKAQADPTLCRQVSIPQGGHLVIRLYPSSNAEEVDVIKDGTKVGIKDQGENGWVPLMAGGYISAKYLKSC
jgi:peptidoglycan hydrolase-like protein with peptidoglycan-binding domain